MFGRASPSGWSPDGFGGGGELRSKLIDAIASRLAAVGLLAGAAVNAAGALRQAAGGDAYWRRQRRGPYEQRKAPSGGTAAAAAALRRAVGGVGGSDGVGGVTAEALDDTVEGSGGDTAGASRTSGEVMAKNATRRGGDGSGSDDDGVGGDGCGGAGGTGVKAMIGRASQRGGTVADVSTIVSTASAMARRG